MYLLLLLYFSKCICAKYMGFFSCSFLLIRNMREIMQEYNIFLNFNYDYFILHNRYGHIHFTLCKQDIQTITVHVKASFVS